MKTSKALLVCILVPALLLTSALAAADASLDLKSSYQATFESDLQDHSGFAIKRARVGAYGSFAADTYFEVVFEGKRTQQEKGAQLKKAFLSWEVIPGHSLDIGAIQLGFTKPISGTEFAFINYDITTSLDPYQYGIAYKGVLGKGFLTWFLAASNGEGLRTENVGKGLLYTGRIQISPFGKPDMTEGDVNKKSSPTLVIGAGYAYDNKAETPDLGVTYEYFNSTHLVLDATFKMMGLSLAAQFNYNAYSQKNDGSYWGGKNENVEKSSGFYVQAGFNLGAFMGMDLEPMVKFEHWVDTINEGYGSEDKAKQHLGLGLNYYVKKHYLKFNVEYRHVLKDENDYFLIVPSDDYVGARMTHKFTTGVR